MQLYHGFPIITNKLTSKEQRGVPHHLLGQIGLSEEPWIVGKFVQKACSAIEEIRARNRLPILVGGTHYYTQALLLADSTVDSKANVLGDHETDIRQSHPIFEADTPTILEKLREVDPIMAARWHPNDRRKIQRSLEIWYQSGKPASQIYEEQANHRAGVTSDSSLGGDNCVLTSRLRFSTLLFWVHTETEILRDRLNRRVERMMQDGLLAEVDSLESWRRDQHEAGLEVDQTRGIWQCIGYKQFKPFLAAREIGKPSEEVEKLKLEAIEQVQAANRQYAKRQIRWIRIKLLHALNAAEASQNLYLLDGTDQESWHTAVRSPAMVLTQQFLDGSPDILSPTDFSATAQEMLQPTKEYDMSDRPDLWRRRTCEVCNITSVTESNWNLHVKSKGHRRAVKNSKFQPEPR